MLELSSQLSSLTQFTVRKQKGSTLMLALFIMIILILLGSALMKVLSSSSEATAQEVIGTRAYMAANSAMQAELSKLFPLNAAGLQCNANATYDFSSSGANIDGLFNCTATTACANYATHPVTNEEFYRLTSTGKCASSALQSDSKNIVVSSRTIQVEAKGLL
jgi:MSHA biogenesis protein MshP